MLSTRIDITAPKGKTRSPVPQHVVLLGRLTCLEPSAVQPWHLNGTCTQFSKYKLLRTYPSRPPKEQEQEQEQEQDQEYGYLCSKVE